MKLTNNLMYNIVTFETQCRTHRLKLSTRRWFSLLLPGLVDVATNQLLSTANAGQPNGAWYFILVGIDNNNNSRLFGIMRSVYFGSNVLGVFELGNPVVTLWIMRLLPDNRVISCIFHINYSLES